MDKVSPEILSLIVGHLFEEPRGPPIKAKPTPHPGASYACTSRRLQDAVEPHNFAHIQLRSTELPALAAVFPPRRRALLRRLDYTVCLPTHGDSRRDHARNLRAFASAIRALVDLLGGWEGGSGGGEVGGALELRLGFEWDIDVDAEGPVDLNFNVCNSSAARRYLTFEHGTEPRGDGLPVALVRRVTSFKVDVTLGRAPHPAAICQLAGLFPNLEVLDVEYWDPAIKRHQMRGEHRAALASGLGTLRERLPRLRRLCISRQGATDPWDHGFECQDLEDGGVDLLCASVRQLLEAGTLAELELVDVLVSPDLFRDQSPGGSGTWPTFPSLRRFMIRVGILAPSGRWYYTGNPAAVEAGSLDPNDLGLGDGVDSDDSGSDSGDSDSGDSDSGGSDSDPDSSDEDNSERDAAANGERPWHQWRTRPDAETFGPLVRDMAHAVLRGMPALEWGCLEMGTTDLEAPVGVIMQCCAAGQAFVQPPDGMRTEDDVLGVRRWKVWVGRGAEWEIPRDVEALWREWVREEGRVETGRWPPMRGE